MAMPRPSGKAQKIAEMVIPGLRKNKSKKIPSINRSSLSEVEIKQTNAIERGPRERFRKRA